MSTKTVTTKLAPVVLFLSGAYLFFVTLALAPFVNITLFSSFHTISKVILVSLAAIFGLIQSMFLVPSISKRLVSKAGFLLTFSIGFTLISLLLSTLFSSSPLTSLFGMFTSWESNWLIWIIYALLFFSWWTYFLLLKQYSLEKTVFHTLLTLLLVVTIVYSLGEYYVWKPNTGYISQGITRLSLGFKNPLLAAYFIGMLSSYAYARALTNFVNKTKPVETIFSTMLFLGINTALLLTFTRSAILMAGLSAFVITAYLLLQKRNRQATIRIIASVILLLTLSGLLGYTYRNEFKARNSDLVAESQQTLNAISQSIGGETLEDGMTFYQNAAQYSSSDIRLLEWKWGLRAWLASPKNFFLGVGPDAGFFELPKYRDPIFNNFPTDSATKPFYIRNLYINTLLQIGLLATLGIATLLFFLGKYLIKNTALDLSLVAIIIAYFAQGIFYYPTHIVTVLLLFAVAVVATDLLPYEETVRKPTSAEKGIFVCLLIIISIWIFTQAKAEYAIERISQNAVPLEQSVVEKYATLPLQNNVLKRFLVYQYPESNFTLGYLTQLAQSKDLDDLRIAADSYYTLAKLKNDTSFVYASIDAYKKILGVDATLPATWDSLGLRYLFVKNFSDAKPAFERAIQLKPDYWYAYMHLGELSRQQCKPQEAIEWYKKAEAFIPTAENEIAEAEQEIENPLADCQ